MIYFYKNEVNNFVWGLMSNKLLNILNDYIYELNAIFTT